MLHYKFYQSSHYTNQLLVMLHGFISDSRTYEAHIDTLRQQSHILVIDLPGHGQDQSSLNETWSFDYICSELDEVLSLYQEYQVYLLGYSMGGRVALYYALHGDVKLTGLILESTSPGIKDEASRIERHQVDRARAQVLEISGLEVFVNDWEKLPLFATQQRLEAETREKIREQRLAQAPVKLAKALRDYGTGHMPNLWQSLSQLTMPVLMLAGEYDEKFVDIAQRMSREMTQSKMQIISGVGHTIHVEDSTEFDTMILGFLKEEQND